MRNKSIKNTAITLLTGAICLFAFAAPTPVYCQAVAVGQATATILAVLSVTSTADLQFGNVLQGVQKTADKTVIAEAGVFQVAGAGGYEISMSLALPTFLWNGTVGSEDRLIIAFSDTQADIDTTAAGTPAAHGAGAIVDQNPHDLPDTALGGADNILQLYLGGTVYPTVDQRAGAYSADIVLTVAYTGT
jgi:hypothetical protein